MSTRTDWGYFRRDGSRLEPVAVGDAHHKWECPNKTWRKNMVEDYWTGETEWDGTYYAENCPMKTDHAKQESCTRCDVIFIYP